jgi:Dot/Icm secretion system protein IcmQ
MDSNLEQQVLLILDELLEKGHWDDGLFLQASGKKLRELREKIAQRVKQPESDDLFQSEHNSRQFFTAASSSTVEVFVLLYSADAHNLKKWESLLQKLDENSIGRPIYQKEEEIQTALRAKQRRENDAYVVVRVVAEDILPPAAEPLTDNLGQKLILLRHGAIQPQNIVRFMHLNTSYHFNHGKLHKDTE